MVMQISAALSSPNFNSEKSYVKKITVYFLTICINFPCKIENFELEVVGVGKGQNFVFRGAISMFYSEIAAKRVTAISFFYLITTYLSITTYIGRKS